MTRLMFTRFVKAFRDRSRLTVGETPTSDAKNCCKCLFWFGWCLLLVWNQKTNSNGFRVFFKLNKCSCYHKKSDQKYTDGDFGCLEKEPLFFHPLLTFNNNITQQVNLKNVHKVSDRTTTIGPEGQHFDPAVDTRSIFSYLAVWYVFLSAESY